MKPDQMASGPPKYVMVCLVPSVLSLGVLMVPEDGVAAPCNMLVRKSTSSASAGRLRAENLIQLSSVRVGMRIRGAKMAGRPRAEKCERDKRERSLAAEP